MAVPKHVDEAAAHLKAASTRIAAARRKPATLDNLAQWLAALTDFSQALADIQSFNNESIHEKLHELAGRAGVGRFPAAGS
jgi:hypothetical protein